MKLDDFDYELPAGAIAAEPAKERDAARLFVHEIGAARTRHLYVRDLPQVLAGGDLLVVNDTRVRPARLHGRRASGGAVEIVLVARAGAAWRALVRPARRLKPGERIELEGGALHARLVDRPLDDTGAPGALWQVELEAQSGASADELLEHHGRMPLPPYLRHARGAQPERDFDRERYQTVFARETGAVAAPTAGLHLTEELFAALATAGIERASLTLHVGWGTFREIDDEDLARGTLHAEEFEIPPATAEAVARCRARAGRVVAVGTTSLRTLESGAASGRAVRAQRGATTLFVRPGHRFEVVDALLTNFHLPRSSLLVLACAFAGRERVLGLYAEALARGYRFFSYGDAMLFLP